MGPKVIFILIVGLAHYTLAKNCPGCPMDRNENDPEVVKSVSQTLSGYSAPPTGTNNEKTSLVRVTKFTSQVVSGVKYTYEFEAKGVVTGSLYNCHLVVWEKPWVGEKKVLDYSCQLSSNIRNKRSMSGGEVELNKDDKDLPKMAHLITDELNKQQKSQYSMGIVNILKATRQVVSGKLTKLSVEVAETDCLIGSPITQKCTPKKENHKFCHVEVFEKPWLQKTEVTVLECHEKPYYCPGCTVETSPNDAIVTQCLKRTLFNLNSKAESTKVWNLKQILKVQTQVVAGIKYIIEFKAEDEAKVAHVCTIVILSQPWITEEPSIADFDCSPLSN